MSQWLYVRNGQMTMWKNHLRVSVDRWGLIEPVDAADSALPTGAAAIVKRDNNISDPEWELKPVQVEQQ